MGKIDDTEIKGVPSEINDVRSFVSEDDIYSVSLPRVVSSLRSGDTILLLVNEESKVTTVKEHHSEYLKIATEDREFHLWSRALYPQNAEYSGEMMTLLRTEDEGLVGIVESVEIIELTQGGQDE